MKKIICFLLSAALLTGLCTALAAGAGDCRCVLGADLTDEQIAGVYKTFGMERGGVKELTVTNAEERALLGESVTEDVIGNKAISSIFIRLLNTGEGYNIVTGNVNWCSVDMYRSALTTAGVTDVELVVTAPFAVSGTAALAGIYKAWEDMTGQPLNAAAKSVGAQELALTAQLAEQFGSFDATELVGELKQLLDETAEMSDEELRAEIQKLAAQRELTLNETQLSQLVTLCRQLEKLDNLQLGDKLRSFKDKLQDLDEIREKLEIARQKLDAFAEKAKAAYEDFREAAQPLFDYLKGLFA